MAVRPKQAMVGPYNQLALLPAFQRLLELHVDLPGLLQHHLYATAVPYEAPVLAVLLPTISDNALVAWL